MGDQERYFTQVLVGYRQGDIRNITYIIEPVRRHKDKYPFNVYSSLYFIAVGIQLHAVPFWKGLGMM